MDEFFTILDTEVGLESTVVAPAILPLIFHGFPTTKVGEIVFYHCRNNKFYQLMSFQSPTGGTKPSKFLDFITPNDTASIHFNVSTSPLRTAVAVETILEYLFDQVELHCSSTYLGPKSWLKRTKPGKHIAVGAPRLASVVYARCTRILRLLEKPADHGYLPHYNTA